MWLSKNSGDFSERVGTKRRIYLKEPMRHRTKRTESVYKFLDMDKEVFD